VPAYDYPRTVVQTSWASRERDALLGDSQLREIDIQSLRTLSNDRHVDGLSTLQSHSAT